MEVDPSVGEGLHWHGRGQCGFGGWFGDCGAGEFSRISLDSGNRQGESADNSRGIVHGKCGFGHFSGWTLHCGTGGDADQRDLSSLSL